MVDAEFMQAQGAANKKIEESLQDANTRILKEESDKVLSEQESATAKRFDETRRLGFVTKRDMEEFFEGVKNTQNVQALEKKFDELREFVLRAKARGLNSGATEEEAKKEEESALKAWERPWVRK